MQREKKGLAATKAVAPVSARGADLEMGILPSLVGRQLRIAQLLAFKDFAMDLNDLNLGAGSFEILELLSHNPGVSHSRLAAAIGLEKSSLVPAIVRLENLEFVERKQSASDKRSNELRITSKGIEALLKLREYVVERERKITRGMTKQEVDMLNDLLKKLAAINA